MGEAIACQEIIEKGNAYAAVYFIAFYGKLI
jgi:hypothetical protein